MLTPLDIQNQSFNRTLRGYDTEEVRTFLRQVAQAWARLLEEQQDLRKKVESLLQEVSRYREMESLLQRTLLQAEESSRALIDNAEKKAQLIVREAEQKAEDYVHALHKEKEAIEAHIEQLKQRRLEVILELRTFLQMQLERLEHLSKDAKAQTSTTNSQSMPPQKLPQAPTAPVTPPSSEKPPWISKLAEKL
jgi:cell division initiation protein